MPKPMSIPIPGLKINLTTRAGTSGGTRGRAMYKVRVLPGPILVSVDGRQCLRTLKVVASSVVSRAEAASLDANLDG